jgi:hypothetical protein
MCIFKHGIRENVTWHYYKSITYYVVFLNTRNVGLNWSLEAAIASYRGFCQL